MNSYAREGSSSNLCHNKFYATMDGSKEINTKIGELLSMPEIPKSSSSRNWGTEASSQGSDPPRGERTNFGLKGSHSNFERDPILDEILDAVH